MPEIRTRPEPGRPRCRISYNTCMCVCVCTYIYIYIYVYTHVYYIHVYVYVYIYIYIYYCSVFVKCQKEIRTTKASPAVRWRVVSGLSAATSKTVCSRRWADGAPPRSSLRPFSAGKLAARSRRGETPWRAVTFVKRIRMLLVDDNYHVCFCLNKETQPSSLTFPWSRPGYV